MRILALTILLLLLPARAADNDTINWQCAVNLPSVSCKVFSFVESEETFFGVVVLDVLDRSKFANDLEIDVTFRSGRWYKVKSLLANICFAGNDTAAEALSCLIKASETGWSL